MRLAIALVLCAATAAAQPSSKQRADATAAYQEGQRRYLDEDYAGAAVQFEAAYKLDPDPAYEFNIAQAYRLGKDCTKALLWYRKFLVDASNAPNVDAVKRYITEQEEVCKTAAATTQPPAPTEPTTPTPDPESLHDTSGTSHLKRNLGYGALGLGAIGLITGAVFTYKTLDYTSQREALCPNPCREWNEPLDLEEDRLDKYGKRAEKLQWVGYGIGAAAIGAGIYLVFIDGKRESPVAVVPTSGGAFVSMTLTR